MSDFNTTFTATALLEIRMVQMMDLQSTITLDSAAGLVTAVAAVAAVASCKSGKHVTVAIDNVSIRSRR